MLSDNISLHANAVRYPYSNSENVLPVLYSWLLLNRSFVLVTLVNIEGGSPRPLGAQVAICETGEAYGYISGGCLKQEIKRKALEVLQTRTNEIVRYGRGSKYIDIQLPCGSGLDLYFDCQISEHTIIESYEKTRKRAPFSLETDLSIGHSELKPLLRKTSQIENNTFIRNYTPPLKLIIAGTDPAVTFLAKTATDSEFKVTVYTPDTDIQKDLEATGIPNHLLSHPNQNINARIDSQTAITLFFHDHSWEIPLLKTFINSPAFYIGAQGSKKTHQTRLEALSATGLAAEALEKIKGPIGLIQGTKSPAALAVSALADIVKAAPD